MLLLPIAAMYALCAALPGRLMGSTSHLGAITATAQSRCGMLSADSISILIPVSTGFSRSYGCPVAVLSPLVASMAQSMCGHGMAIVKHTSIAVTQALS